MKVHKLFSDAAGESHWTNVEVDLAEREFAPPAQNVKVSEPEPATRMAFLKLRAGWNEPVHPSPVRQKLICLAGSVRVTASDGEFRDIGRGEVWHMEDTGGKGHHTVVTSDEDFEAVVIQFE